MGVVHNWAANPASCCHLFTYSHGKNGVLIRAPTKFQTLISDLFGMGVEKGIP